LASPATPPEGRHDGLKILAATRSAASLCIGGVTWV
jgi:hypothetical protein